MGRLFFLEKVSEVGFGAVWTMIPERWHRRARKLIALLLMTLLASWDFRFEKPMQETSMLLLHLLGVPPDEEFQGRNIVDTRLLIMTDKELEQESKFTDLPGKLRVLMRHDVITMRDTGRLTPKLHAFLLFLRARLPYEI